MSHSKAGIVSSIGLPGAKGPNTPLPEAQKILINFYKQGQPENVLPWCDYILAKQPDAYSFLIIAGGVASTLCKYDLSIEYLLKAVALNQNDPEPRYLLGNAYAGSKRPFMAGDSYRQALELKPDHSEASIGLGEVLIFQEKLEEAEEVFRRALAGRPDNLQAQKQLCKILIKQKNIDEAIVICREMEITHPDSFDVQMVKVDVMEASGNIEEAVDAMWEVLKANKEEKTYFKLGSLYAELKQIDKAVEVYKKCIAEHPGSIGPVRVLADCYMHNSLNKEAEEAYRTYLALRPTDPSAYNNLANILRANDNFYGAEKAYIKALEIDPTNAMSHNNLAILMMEMAKPVESIEYYRKSMALNPSYLSGFSNMLFFMNYVDTMTPEMLFEEHKVFDQRFCQNEKLDDGVFLNKPDPDRKLRIGYVSADFCGHVVSYFTNGMFEHYDRSKFEVYCYAHVKHPDHMTDKIKNHVDHWRMILNESNEDLAHLIKADGIDILVDLAGHTAGNRLVAFSYRPAPIQMTWIGYPNTTGMKEMDYRITDVVADPPGRADEVHTEKLLRLEKGFLCYTPQTPLEGAEKAPCFENGYITFGSFNNLAKVSDKTIKAWAEILQRVPNAKILVKAASLSDEGTRDHIRKKFEQYNIDRDRVMLRGKVPNSNKHLEMYSEIDIGLDSFPYNGTTTTCEAFLMGLPVIGLKGDRHAACVGASLLTFIGMEELVADNEEEYVQLAADLAGDPDRIQHLRSTMRDRFLNSDICNAKEQTRILEEAYRSVWRDWCDAQV